MIEVIVGSGLSGEDVSSWIEGKGEALRQCWRSSLDNQAVGNGIKKGASLAGLSRRYRD